MKEIAFGPVALVLIGMGLMVIGYGLLGVIKHWKDK
jgi:hypothetical protein